MNPYSIFTRHGSSSGSASCLKGKLSRDEYDEIPALSNTVVKKWDALSSTPSEFKWWLHDRWNDDNSAAKAKGSALDCLLTEPENLPSKFLVFTASGPKRITEKHREDNPGRIVLAHEEFDSALKMAEALRASKHTAHGKDFDHAGKQVAVASWLDAPWKCEFDLWTERSHDIIDIKSARDVGQDAFGRAAAEFGYFQQATVYLSIARALGYDKRSFNFITVKNSEPYTVKPYRFRPFDCDEHMEIFNANVTRVGNAMDSLILAMANGFVDSDLWQDIVAPSWYLHQCKLI